MTLAASMYTIAIGVSSRSRLLFGMALALGFLLAFVFGLSEPNEESLTMNGILASAVIGLVFVLHSCERYNRHVVDRADFWLFVREEEGI